jgi:hypothetical protein
MDYLYTWLAVEFYVAVSYLVYLRRELRPLQLVTIKP